MVDSQKTALLKEEKRTEYIAKFKEFLHEAYYTEMVKAGNNEESVAVDFVVLDKSLPDMSELLKSKPEQFFDISDNAVSQIELPSPVKLRFFNLPELLNIRDIRARHLNTFFSIEGIVRKASEIRPEIIAATWKCLDCEDLTTVPAKNGFVGKPFKCNCGSRNFEQVEKEMIDTRWVVIEEPFELTEGEKPSQLTILMKEDLVSPDGRRYSDPGNRIKVTGILRDVPKGKSWSTKLDFFHEANHIEPLEIGWHQLDISENDIKEIKKLSKRKDIYEIFVDSLAPSLYGLREIKESIILQLFGGVPRTLKDGTHFRGDIHILLIGDPSAGKSQLLKLVPEIVPRGRYVSGKGVTGAGLTATVTKDEQFMGGWVLEAGALVLANKGLLSIDEFEKMSPEDQVAMHEALEQGTISIAKASIVATLPAKTSVLAGGNPKFSRFDPYVPISKQITIPDTLLSRFDLKFAMRDIPNQEEDRNIVDHVLSVRQDENYEKAIPKLKPDFIRKYIAYARDSCQPSLTPEAGKLMKNFYIRTRRKASGGEAAIPITLRQFEAMIRLSEASAKIQLHDKVRKEDAQRAIKLVKFSLRQLGLDPETGEIDVDRSEGLTSSSERGRIKAILDIINEMSEKKKEIPIQDIRDAAKKENIGDVDEILDKLRREGMLFEPTPGFIQKV